MRRNRPGIHRIMKYIILVLLIAFLTVLMLYASESTKAFTDVERAVSASLDDNVLSKETEAGFKRAFGLNAADYDGVMYYVSDFNLSAEEVLLVRVKSDSQTKEILTAIEERIAAQKADFGDHVPEAVGLLDRAKTSVRGKYVFFAVSEKADEYLKAFRDNL